MEKSHKILFLVFAAFILILIFSLVSSSGRYFWSQSVVVPLLKPFSEPCGYGGTSNMKVECNCDKTLFSEIAVGATNYYCTGKCSQCRCYKQDWSTFSETKNVKLTEADCATFSQLSWAFPFE